MKMGKGWDRTTSREKGPAGLKKKKRWSKALRTRKGDKIWAWGNQLKRKRLEEGKGQTL